MCAQTTPLLWTMRGWEYLYWLASLLCNPRQVGLPPVWDSSCSPSVCRPISAEVGVLLSIVSTLQATLCLLHAEHEHHGVKCVL